MHASGASGTNWEVVSGAAQFMRRMPEAVLAVPVHAGAGGLRNRWAALEVLRPVELRAERWQRAALHSL
eukprot:44951-Alexandrium_andersonii.AAC.1